MRPTIACTALALCAVLCACSGGDKDSFRNVDHDRNGKLSYEELLFVFPDVTPDIFAQEDANHDGSLSEEEYKAFLKGEAADTFGRKPAPMPAPTTGSKPKPHQGQTVAPASPQGTVPSRNNEEVIEIPAPDSEQNAKARAAKAKREAAAKSEAADRTGPTEYTVQRGDNLSRIARKFGVSVEDIARANGNMNPDTLRDGQTLTIPARP